MILILTSCDDPTAGRVEAELRSRGVRCHRIDLSDFPQRITTSARLGGLGRWTGEIRHDDGWTVALEDVTAIYYRRPTNFNPASGLDHAERRFAIAEARAGFGGVLACLPVQWVNHPFRVADAEFKPGQLSSARESDFCVPETLITNDGHRARHFVETLSPHVVYKPLGGGFHRDNNNDLSIIYATRIAVESLQDDEIASTSHTFQRFIDKKHDVRVTAAGHRLFATAICTESHEGRIDWRSDYESLNYTEISVPDTVRASIDLYLRRYGLLYGAFDFSVDRDDCWWFLECNPNGQWGFIAEVTGVPIAASIADLLTGEACS